MGTNSGDLLPTWPLPAQQVVPDGGKDNGSGGKDKSGRGKRVEKRELQPLYHVLLASFII
ncbi:hypothetical protein E2C01_009565 [Portunus trituberculatus]|uniref:Uncharacterized protein n=1 Tax=Portunus trituberculatus TaxID=210409 RepID=A0A5B7D638_PORTR|nr:hypothetical protein [Portunus trituberculatus]